MSWPAGSRLRRPRCPSPHHTAHTQCMVRAPIRLLKLSKPLTKSGTGMLRRGRSGVTMRHLLHNGQAGRTSALSNMRCCTIRKASCSNPWPERQEDERSTWCMSRPPCASAKGTAPLLTASGSIFHASHFGLLICIASAVFRYCFSCAQSDATAIQACHTALSDVWLASAASLIG